MHDQPESGEHTLEGHHKEISYHVHVTVDSKIDICRGDFLNPTWTDVKTQLVVDWVWLINDENDERQIPQKELSEFLKTVFHN